MPPKEPDSEDQPLAEDGEEMLGVPAFAAGGRVDRTGLALIHEGEWILPAPGSEAVISPEMSIESPGQVINFYFPVEIEIVGSISQSDLERVARYVFDALEAELSSRV